MTPPSTPPPPWWEREVPAWVRRTRGENRLPVAGAIVVAVALQIAIPDRYGLTPQWLIPGLEVVLLAGLIALNPIRMERGGKTARAASLVLVAAITADNVYSAVRLAHTIVTGHQSGDAIGLLSNGAAIYVTNVIAFGIWFWELDRGGPLARAEGGNTHPDFLFPQMTSPQFAPKDWEPRFLDYLYVSFTNVVAFSPTDTMPMSRWTKGLMATQSVVALAIAALVVARAVNVLR